MDSPFGIMLALWRRKGMLLALCFVGLAFGSAVCLYSPKIYEAETLILIRKPASAPGRTNGADDPAVVHTRILASSEVILGALRTVSLNPDEDRSLGAYIAKARDFARSLMEKSPSLRTNEMFLSAMRNLRVSVEPGGEIIRVKFKYGNAETAALFLNAIADNYAARLQELSQWQDSSPIAAKEQELVHAYKNAYDQLTEFSSKTNVYSSDEQQQLALRRRNDLLTAIAETRSAIEDKTAQLATYPDQLSKMKPLARVLGTSDIVGPVPTDKRRKIPDTEDVTANTPPLLLQKVYQDTVQTVVKLRTELAGLEKKLDQLVREQQHVDSELNSLAQYEAEYNKLLFQVNQTRSDAEAYTKWITDQRSLSPLPEIQILQSARPPVRAMFPRPELVLSFCALLSMLLGAACIATTVAVSGSSSRFAHLNSLAALPHSEIATDLPAPPLRSWNPNIKKLENTPAIKQLGTGTA